MAERRTLIEGLKQTPAVEPAVERDFVFAGKLAPGGEEAIKSIPSTPSPSTAATARAPLSTRIRSDYAAALKRASLERQLAKVERVRSAADRLGILAESPRLRYLTGEPGRSVAS